MVKKGYIRKVASPLDKREIRLQLTDRFYHYYNISCDYISRIMASLGKKLSESESTQFIETMKSMLHVMDECKEVASDESANFS